MNIIKYYFKEDLIIVPIIGALGESYLLVMTLFDDPKTAIIGVVAALIGIPVYIYSKKKYAGQEIYISE